MTAQRAHRLAILGAGRIAHSHADAISRHPSAQLCAVVDMDCAAAERFAERHGAEVVTADLDDLLTHHRPDGLVICSPTAVHAEQSLRALTAGVPVLVEKPFAADLESALLVVEAGRRSDVVVMGAQVVRFLPMFTKARELVDAGVLGRPVQAVERRLVHRAERFPWWRDVPAFLVSHWGSHSLDVVTHLTGGVIDSVFCDGRSVMRDDDGVVDDFSLVARYRGGFRFTSTMSFASRAPKHDIVLIGEDATLEFECFRRLLVDGEVCLELSEAEMLRAGFDAQLDEFIRLTKGGGTGIAAASTIVHGLAALHAAAESVRTAEARLVV